MVRALVSVRKLSGFMKTTTTIPIESNVTHAWRLVDADGLPAGRLAVALANMLRGKDRPDYTPHINTGDFIVVVNAEKVKLTGNKEEKKIYKDYSGYPGGLKERPAAMIRAKNPTRIIVQAVHGMLPANHTRRVLMRRLKVYVGAEHPHVAQNPKPTKLDL